MWRSGVGSGTLVGGKGGGNGGSGGGGTMGGVGRCRSVVANGRMGDGGSGGGGDEKEDAEE